MDCNIVLVGMPASGKTTIGTILEKQLHGYSLYDTDSIIEKTNGMTVAEIFSKYSEDYFRKLEYDTIKMIACGKKKIISTGGGAFENPDNRAMLLNCGKVFYLKSDLDILYCRISEDSTRPLLQHKNPKQILQDLLQKREENYNKAHYTVNTSLLSEDEIIRFILNAANS